MDVVFFTYLSVHNHIAYIFIFICFFLLQNCLDIGHCKRIPIPILNNQYLRLFIWSGF